MFIYVSSDSQRIFFLKFLGFKVFRQTDRQTDRYFIGFIREIKILAAV